jgi:diadenosine tetraphosphatase ApaH/serine/threonine PP2A family protein phosphatase
MRYAIFTDIHANLEALDAVLEKIDALSKEKPIDHIWFLGDLVGYGPNPNECIDKLRKRTDVMIAGNHDWAAVGKIDLEDFSAAARISAEWTAEQLTEENKNFLANLPERIEMGECTLVHGSPYGPLWEYLTSEVLAERSFQHFSSRFCFVGHTHVPVIFQQPDAIANAPTLPLVEEVRNGKAHARSGNESANEEHTGESEDTEDTDETAEMAVIQPPAHSNKLTITAESAYADPTSGKVMSEEEANSLLEAQKNVTAETQGIQHTDGTDENEIVEDDEQEAVTEILIDTSKQHDENETGEDDEDSENEDEDENEGTPQDAVVPDVMHDDEFSELDDDGPEEPNEQGTTEEVVANAEDRLNSEIEELLTLLGLSESMIQVTNEMLQPPLGHWEAPKGYRAIINPGGVGQPRDGDPRAAFMIYDTEEGFEFYRIPYPFNKTQEKIIKAGLPQYLAVRLAYGR